MRLEEKLAALRREHKMTQAELAETVAKWRQWSYYKLKYKEIPS